MPLLFNKLSGLIRPSKKHTSFNFMAAVTIHSDLEPKKRKSVTASIFYLSICHEVMRLGAMILSF